MSVKGLDARTVVLKSYSSREASQPRLKRDKMYTSSIDVKTNPELLLKCLKPELESFKSKSDRSSLTFSKTKNKVNFKVEAKDSVALRATLTSLTNLFTVFEKMQNIK